MSLAIDHPLNAVFFHFVQQSFLFPITLITVTSFAWWKKVLKLRTGNNMTASSAMP